MFIILLLWFACGLLVYGLSVAYWQGEFPLTAPDYFVSDRVISGILALFGPVSLLGLLITVGVRSNFRHGWRL